MDTATPAVLSDAEIKRAVKKHGGWINYIRLLLATIADRDKTIAELKATPAPQVKEAELIDTFLSIAPFSHWDAEQATAAILSRFNVSRKAG